MENDGDKSQLQPMEVFARMKAKLDFIRAAYHFFTFRVLALTATIIVLRLIKTAPAAGLNNIPELYKTPAANGNATML